MLEELRQNITRIIALYESQKKRADELETSLSDARRQLQTCNEQIIDLKRQISNFELTGAFVGGQGDNELAKARIDKLISEIDRCISMLEN